MIETAAIITLYIFFPISFFVWLYGLYDAYTEADKINKGQVPAGPEPTMQDALVYAGVFIGLLVGFFIIFFIIGFFFGLLML
ncbi:hypothetical protein MmiEs2_11160 [Methanimicrococcus stummii]|uniref:Uncharacterized protein n=1 Tax=Methanimicrococcus stummii TaxID=3028294 RepID=A0AA96V9Y5_9EURY|nr:hypothetical protein [Methanimicrococcus sp. Es2]WNY28903.1 hypothetical protein MmiEs2_11160 [Methanimicrococcus sp. Es2]